MSIETTPRSATVTEVTRELEVLLESQTFKQAPRLGKLLGYICQKALTEHGQPVTEYTIAIDVFGKPLEFKDTNDSSVRVEIHRLRKRLTQFYATEGCDRPIRILLPPGRYTPRFAVVHELSEHEDALGSALVAAELNPVVPEEAPPQLQEAVREIASSPKEAPPAPFPKGLLVISGVLLLLAVAAALGWRRLPSSHSGRPPSAAPQEVMQPTRVGLPLADGPVRIMAGYDGSPHTDSFGNVWGPDRYFHRGHTWRQNEIISARTNDPLLFQQWRSGEFSYDVPLAPGVYELHLYFVHSEFGPQAGNAESQDTFSISMNGGPLMPDMDVASDAMGSNIADERVFKNMRPANDGFLHLGFAGTKGIAVINALEILPGIPNRQLPVRLVMQPVSFTDHAGQKWSPDNYYLNGRTVARNLSTTGTPDAGLFAMERYGHFTYAIPVDVTGRYTVVLHFAEMYFGPNQPGRGGVGSRVFNVMANGVSLLEDFDVFKEVGGQHALTKTFHHLKPTAQGKLNLTFEPVKNYAFVSAIEVLDESR